jgi:nucleoside-diphosphate-sugar epimerase
MDGMIQRILITGGAGYLGSVLARELISQGYDVTVADNLMYSTESLLGLAGEPAFICEVVDIRFSELLYPLLDEIDAVVHLAAIVGDPACRRKEDLATETNLKATKALYDESCRRGVKRFIFASTCSNYGAQDPDEFVDENGNLRPLSHYAETKVSSEQFILNHQSNGVIPTILRFSTIYGLSHRNRFDLTINQFVKEAIKEKQIEIWGEQYWRPYIHVKDACKAVCAVLDADSRLVAGQVFNVGEDTQNFQKKTIAKIIDGMIPGVEFAFVPVKDDPRSYRVSFKKIKQMLNYSIDHRLEDGIEEIRDAIWAGRIDSFEGKACIN